MVSVPTENERTVTEMADFTIVSRPVSIRFQCPFCESEEEIPWEEVKHPDYWGDEWDDIECPSCGKMVSLGEWIYD